MARFEMELPVEIMSELEKRAELSEQMMTEMVTTAAEVVYDEVDKNLARSFKSTDTLRRHLKITRVYYKDEDDSINIKIAFYGYDVTKKSSRYPKGVPVPLIALAREYGTRSGEKKKPFFRKAFRRGRIEDAMMRVQQKYIKGE